MPHQERIHIQPDEIEVAIQAARDKVRRENREAEPRKSAAQRMAELRERCNIPIEEQTPAKRRRKVTAEFVVERKWATPQATHTPKRVHLWNGDTGGIRQRAHANEGRTGTPRLDLVSDMRSTYQPEGEVVGQGMQRQAEHPATHKAE